MALSSYHIDPSWKKVPSGKLYGGEPSDASPRRIARVGQHIDYHVKWSGKSLTFFQGLRGEFEAVGIGRKIAWTAPDDTTARKFAFRSFVYKPLTGNSFNIEAVLRLIPGVA